MLSLPLDVVEGARCQVKFISQRARCSVRPARPVLVFFFCAYNSAREHTTLSYTTILVCSSDVAQSLSCRNTKPHHSSTVLPAHLQTCPNDSKSSLLTRDRSACSVTPRTIRSTCSQDCIKRRIWHTLDWNSLGSALHDTKRLPSEWD